MHIRMQKLCFLRMRLKKYETLLAKIANPSLFRFMYQMFLFKCVLCNLTFCLFQTFNTYKHKFKFYYGTSDGWSPLKFYSNLKEKVPDVDAIVCDKGIQHAFTIKSSSLMADMISGWIQESIHGKATSAN